MTAKPWLSHKQSNILPMECNHVNRYGRSSGGRDDGDEWVAVDMCDQGCLRHMRLIDRLSIVRYGVAFQGALTSINIMVHPRSFL